MKRVILISILIIIIASCNTIENPGFYKSDEDRLEYNKVYDSILEGWPVDYNEIYIDTDEGKTFILNWGNKEKPPLVLLHPNVCASVDFKFIAETLSDKYNVYAIDTIGEPGRTETAERPVERSTYVNWLKEVTDALGIEKFSLMGYSMGSAIATYYTLENQHQVEKLVVMAPTLSIVPPTTSSFFSLAIPFLFQSQEGWADSTMRWQSSDFEQLKASDSEFYTRFRSSFFYFDPNSPDLKPAALEELAALETPFLIIIGENDAWIDTDEFFARLDSANVRYKEYILEGGNHLFSLEEKAEINRILQHEL